MSNSAVLSCGRDESVEFDIECLICSGIVIEYFEEKYNGMRGMCSNCRVNFPLD